ncbi:hypothetical protein, partial [Streptomyces sp. SM10]|uniref:hypothetical protein n=1 Tax=Streptomyces sp. SM10 TaxID=565556 RepID=UPI001CA5B301
MRDRGAPPRRVAAPPGQAHGTAGYAAPVAVVEPGAGPVAAADPAATPTPAVVVVPAVVVAAAAMV